MNAFGGASLTYQRRLTREVTVGNVAIGGDNPIRIQSMLTCDTMDTAACVAQTLGLATAGCEIVRITAPTVNDAANLKNIKRELLKHGCPVPIVADIHFKPEAAMEAAQWVEKVRINPGNFADKKKFQVREYTDAQYAEALAQLEEAFTPLVKLCRERNVAMRIGVNHGSLSDRILNRFGDTPLGMVEGALEYARVARQLDFHNFVFSMKASNPKVMIAAYRLLVSRLNELGEDWNYPLHLGVTEAGDGEDGRIKSAVGIGALLLDGLGDTLRVSLTEDSLREIPVAKALVERIRDFSEAPPMNSPTLPASRVDPFSYQRRKSLKMDVNGVSLGDMEVIRIVADKKKKNGALAPDFDYKTSGVVEVDAEDDAAIQRLNRTERCALVTIRDGCRLNPVTAFRWLAGKLDARHPLLLKDTFHAKETLDDLNAMLSSAINIGSLLCDGIGDAIFIRRGKKTGEKTRLAYTILQACGARFFKTEYVACPSCGRTLFDIQSAMARIKAATQHLKGVKIAVMGCIVNGPGEMADADFGYVGGAPGKINLYVNKTAVKFNIPEAEAVERLKELIQEHGKWVDP